MQSVCLVPETIKVVEKFKSDPNGQYSFKFVLKFKNESEKASSSKMFESNNTNNDTNLADYGSNHNDAGSRGQ